MSGFRRSTHLLPSNEKIAEPHLPVFVCLSWVNRDPCHNNLQVSTAAVDFWERYERLRCRVPAPAIQLYDPAVVQVSHYVLDLLVTS